jgi:predicted nucleotidyltransferase
MADDPEKSALERLAEVLLRHGVEFIVVGGQAEVLLGSPRVTYDVDFCYRRSRENLDRLAAAIVELDVKLRGAPPDLPFQIDARALALGANFTFTTRFGALDLLGHLEPLGGYEAVAERADTYRVGDLELRTIALDDLIAIKRHIRRPKDRESLLQLLAIKRLRNEDREPS